MKVRYLSERRVPLAAISGLHPAMAFAQEQVWIVYRMAVGRDPVITGAQEAAHSEGSLHYGLFPDPRLRALDFDDDDISEAQRVIIQTALRERLGSQFDVVWESNHLHVEYDVTY